MKLILRAKIFVVVLSSFISLTASAVVSEGFDTEMTANQLEEIILESDSGTIRKVFQSHPEWIRVKDQHLRSVAHFNMMKPDPSIFFLIFYNCPRLLGEGDDQGQTPIHYAARNLFDFSAGTDRNRLFKVLSTLCDHPDFMWIRDHAGKTPVEYARESILKMITKKNSDLICADEKGSLQINPAHFDFFVSEIKDLVKHNKHCTRSLMQIVFSEIADMPF